MTRYLVEQHDHLAAALFAARKYVEVAEARVEELLDSLFGKEPDNWTHFETDSRDRSIEVFGCIPSEAAADALFRAGFQRVSQHEHDYGEFRRCACKVSRVA